MMLHVDVHVVICHDTLCENSGIRASLITPQCILQNGSEIADFINVSVFRTCNSLYSGVIDPPSLTLNSASGGIH